MTDNLMFDVFLLGIVLGFGIYLCVDILTEKKRQVDEYKLPDPPSR